MKRTAVIALGGNALLKGDQSGSIQEQELNTLETCYAILKLLKEYDSLVITHGNGPQVGNILLRNDAGLKNYNIQPMPLDICVADSQGGIGYLLERQLRNVLAENGIKKEVISIITQVLVDENDPAFANPTKPVGPYYSKDEADKFTREQNWKCKEDPRGRGWRRVVPSPRPKEIFNCSLIERLAKEGQLVIASGGGGIPVVAEGDWINGVEAVIDKDLAASLMAREIKAEALFILTDIAKVAINFRKEDEQFLDEITVADAEKYYAAGEFAAGSMGPKVLSAIEFLKAGGKKAVITEANELGNKNSGTTLIN